MVGVEFLAGVSHDGSELNFFSRALWHPKAGEIVWDMRGCRV